MAEIIKIENEKAITYSNAINKVIKCLSEGGIAVLPTETVYGMAARWDNKKSISRLLDIRQSPADKNLTIAIGSISQLSKYVKVCAPSTKRIIEKFMPGPITVVFDYENTGIRFPDNEFTRKVLSECNFPIVLPSANTSGKEPKTRGEDVIKEFSEKVDIIVDAGITKYKTSSTVIRSGYGILKELRNGIISFDEIRKTARMTIAFVCTGNTCRSPLAEIFTKSLLAQKYEVPIKDLAEFGYNIISCGTATWDGLPASNFAVESANRYNLDLTNHKAMQINLQIIKESDRIFCMSEEHISYILKLFPDSIIKLMKLRADGENIQDPAFSSYKEYETCAIQIKQEVEKIVETLL